MNATNTKLPLSAFPPPPAPKMIPSVTIVISGNEM